MSTMKQAKWGMWLSALCAVHCLLTPIAVVAMPIMGAELFHNEFAEFLMIASGLFFSVYSVTTAYWNVHKNINVLLGVLAGFALVILGHFVDWFWLHIAFSVVGSIIIIFSLYKNNLLLRKCSCNA